MRSALSTLTVFTSWIVMIIVDVMYKNSMPEQMTIASLKYLAVHQIKPVTQAPLVGKTLEAAHRKIVSIKIVARAVGICHRLRLGNLFLRNERKVVSRPNTNMVIGAIQIAGNLSDMPLGLFSVAHTGPY